ncbi:MAG: alpha/beta fold hydrolase [Stellaceae bacterium]
MPKALINGIHLHYQQVGRGPDVGMIHGITGNQAIWHLQILPALMHEHRFTTYDLRGHGYSEMPPKGYTTADHASDFCHLLDKLGIERSHVVGHSFGADVALHCALLYPERIDRLVLVEPAIAALQFLREHKDWIGWKYWRDKLRAAGVSVPPDQWYDAEYLVRASIRIPKQFGFRKGRDRRAAPLIRLMQTTTVAVDYSDVAGMTLARIAEVGHPSLLVYGANSVFMGTCEYLQAHLPNCTAVIIPGGEHFGPLEEPEVLIDHVRKFFSDEAPPRAKP